ncbi:MULTISPECIES: hypothetical protein [unclassified Clostridium]|uniref:hypothetical protein n=1 Tax=unclassified Clostridium TaxID=2614128 RepID=UPI0002983444|nr:MULTISPECIES: hypothetical protein [unclassified Clostridium]EKQ51395.1 MAG: hypothetical protein A370_04922 [Clostridium sp. Maddingley MBC34-26]
MNKKDEKKEINEMSFEDFLNKSIDRSGKQKNEEKIDIPGWGSVPFRRPNNDQILDYLNAQGNAIKFNKDGLIMGTDLKSLSESAAEFIYFTCPYLQNTSLQEAHEVKDPLDTAIKIFGVENVVDIANLILKKFNIEKTIRKSIKN